MHCAFLCLGLGKAGSGATSGGASSGGASSGSACGSGGVFGFLDGFSGFLQGRGTIGELSFECLLGSKRKSEEVGHDVGWVRFSGATSASGRCSSGVLKANSLCEHGAEGDSEDSHCRMFVEVFFINYNLWRSEPFYSTPN